MTWVSHPTGNTFVRALLEAISSSGQDLRFHTALGFSERALWFKCLPRVLQKQLSRRAYDLPPDACRPHRTGEVVRLLLNRLLTPSDVERRFPALGPHGIYRQLDLTVAVQLLRSTGPVSALHAYEDGAHYSFLAASERGVPRHYHLPIAYWATSQRLLREEATRLPEWAPTLGSGLCDPRLQERKAAELDLATNVFCPSEFVRRSLPDAAQKKCFVAPFGSPPQAEIPGKAACSGPLRVLFAGSFTQRKGLADVFAAFKQLNRPDVELILAGSPILPLDFYRRQYPGFRYEPARSHPDFLQLMRGCDLLVLPSLVEGRALVQQEAMSNGLPILITPNTGGEDLVEPGTGFLVPIRQPERIAERIDWLADHRSELPEMRRLAQVKARQFSWERYAATILDHSARCHPAGPLSSILLDRAQANLISASIRESTFRGAGPREEDH